MLKYKDTLKEHGNLQYLWSFSCFISPENLYSLFFLLQFERVTSSNIQRGLGYYHYKTLHHSEWPVNCIFLLFDGLYVISMIQMWWQINISYHSRLMLFMQPSCHCWCHDNCLPGLLITPITNLYDYISNLLKSWVLNLLSSLIVWCSSYCRRANRNYLVFALSSASFQNVLH